MVNQEIDALGEELFKKEMTVAIRATYRANPYARIKPDDPTLAVINKEVPMDQRRGFLAGFLAGVSMTLRAPFDTQCKVCEIWKSAVDDGADTPEFCTEQQAVPQ